MLVQFRYRVAFGFRLNRRIVEKTLGFSCNRHHFHNSLGISNSLFVMLLFAYLEFFFVAARWHTVRALLLCL